MGVAEEACGLMVAGVVPFFAACSSWKAVVPLVTRRALQDAKPFAGVASHWLVYCTWALATCAAMVLAVTFRGAGVAAPAWAAVPSPARASAAVATAAVPMRRHLPCVNWLLGGDVRNVQPPVRGLAGAVRVGVAAGAVSPAAGWRPAMTIAC